MRKVFLFALVSIFSILSIESCGGHVGPSQSPDSDTISVKEKFTPLYQNDKFAQFLRSLPRKDGPISVKNFRGEDTNMDGYKYRVIDFPLLSDIEQCADVCMHLRAEYLFRTKQYGKIHFNDVSGHNFQYTGGASRKALEAYLRKVYAVSNTASLYHEMQTVPFKDIRPGDVFMYPATSSELGHAMIVMDVAKGDDGSLYFQIAQGFTPACDLHIVKNPYDSKLSPWYKLDVNAREIEICGFTFTSVQLKRWR